jgi:hypothetical protein
MTGETLWESTKIIIPILIIDCLIGMTIVMFGEIVIHLVQA